MSTKEAPEKKVARAFNITRGDDMALGKLFWEDKELQKAWGELQSDGDAQNRFLKIFNAAHGRNRIVQERLHSTINMAEERSHQKLSKFQAIGFIISAAQNAFRNGGPL